MSPLSKYTLVPVAILIAMSASSCRSSKTAKKIASFADEVCACKEAQCAKDVQEEYLQWWTDHQRARGSEEDRSEVEGSMERFATCYQTLVGEEKSTVVPQVPKVDLAPAGAPPTPAAALEGAVDAGTAKTAPVPAVNEPTEVSPKATTPALPEKTQGSQTP